MTSSTDTAGHPDVTELSDLTEGILPPTRSADLRRHLEGCEPCADVQASLEEIRALLGGMPEPSPMPQDVADRIDAALAVEALSRATTGALTAVEAGEAQPASGDPQHVSRETEKQVSRETSVPDRPTGRPAAATGPGRKERGRSRRRSVALGAVLTAAVVGAGSLLLQSLGSDSPDTTAQTKPAPAVTTFSGASVQSQVKGLLTAQKGLQRGTQRPREESATASPGSPTQSANTLIQTAVPVPYCIRQAVESRNDVLAAKTGTYAGKKAYLVVLPDTMDSTRVLVYVVDASCIVHRPAASGDVLLKQSLARN
ncbi:anti-sigma factor [Streptomyces sp. NPDC048242]|uniref:anti-sigma factor family protein n=1 Tax=Streptomyces sp. NPDC048242 TaxID=3155026 RepID=UPI003423F5CD